MKRKASTWMLLISALLLGGFILLFERKSETSWQEEHRTATVFAVYPESIEQIVLKRGGVTMECVRTGSEWRLVRPTDAPLDSAIVEKMLAGMTRVQRGELISPDMLAERGLTPADYGFEAPRARLSFRNSRGTFTWLIGRDAPLGDTLYVMNEQSGDIISAARTLLHLIPEDPAWIRDRILFTGEPASVRGIDLRRTAGFLQLRQPENNGWVIQQPVTGRANRQAVHTLIENIFSARIDTFVTDEKTDLTVYGLETPTIELTVFTSDGQAQTLYLGKPVPDRADALYAKYLDSDSVFTVPAGWTSALETDAEQLRSRTLCSMSPQRITGISLTHGEETVELTRTNETWQILRPVRWAADPDRVQEILAAYQDAVVEQFIDTPSPSQSAATESSPWKITFRAGNKTYAFHISDVDTNGLHTVRCDQAEWLCTVNKGLVQEDWTNPLFYRGLEILTVNPARIERLDVLAGSQTNWAQKTASGTFSSAPGMVIDTEALTDLIWQLNDLKAERHIVFNPESLELYGLDNPWARISVTLSDTNSIGHVLLIGQSVTDGHFAMIQGRDTVFILSNETVDQLTRPLSQPGQTK